MNTTPRAAWSAQPIPFYVLLLLTLALWGGEVATRDFWEPDEARFVLVAREMRADGHWLVPHRQGEFYTHKPPLMFWLINAGIAAGLPERVASRAPSMLGALMALWAITRIAARRHGPEASWWVALLLPSSFLFWNKGGFGQIDMLFCGLQMMGLHLLLDSRDNLRRAGAYLFLGLAILAKGPVGLLVPMAVYFATLWADGALARARSLHWVWGPLLALAIPGVWLAAAWWRGAPAGFFEELLFKQNVGRVTGEFGGHLKPWYYFLMYFPLDFLPWSLMLPAAVRAHAGSRNRDWRYLAAWIATVILLFSLSASKRNLYILMAYPAAALLIAAAIPRWSFVPGVWLKWSQRVVTGLMAVLALGLWVAPFVPKAHMPWFAAFPPALALTVGLVLAVRRSTDDPRRLAVSAASVLATFALVGALIYHQVDDRKTPDEIAGVAAELLEPSQFIILYKKQGEILSVYANRPGRMADNPEELRALLARQPRHLIVTDPRHLSEIEPVIGTGHPTGELQFGSKRRIWIAVDQAVRSD